MARSILFQFLLEADNDAGKLKNMLHIRGAHENTHDNGTVAGHSVANAIFKVLLEESYMSLCLCICRTEFFLKSVYGKDFS